MTDNERKNLIKVYEEVLKGRLSRFPQGTFTEDNYIEKATIVVKYLLKEKLNYGDRKIRDVWSVKFIKEYKLGGLLAKFDGSPFEMISNCMSDKEFKQYQFRSVPKGYWTDEHANEAMKWFFKEEIDLAEEEVTSLNYIRELINDGGFEKLIIKKYHGCVFSVLNIIYPNKFKIIHRSTLVRI